MIMKSIVLATLGILVAALPAWAVSPTVRLIQPVGGQRGTEVVVTLTGQRLADIQEILFYQPGITVTKIVGGKDAQAVATFKIAPGAELGLHDFRVRTATGISSLKTFSVGTLRDVAEVEPNDDFARPQAVSMNVTVNGVAGKEDIDYFEVRARKGERITAEVEGIRLGLTLFDPCVTILNAKRFELASSDDNALTWQDCFVSLVAPRMGRTRLPCARRRSRAIRSACTACISATSQDRPRRSLPAASWASICAFAGSATCWAKPRPRSICPASPIAILAFWRTIRAATRPTRTCFGSARLETRSRPSPTITTIAPLRLQLRSR